MLSQVPSTVTVTTLFLTRVRWEDRTSKLLDGQWGCLLAEATRSFTVDHRGLNIVKILTKLASLKSKVWCGKRVKEGGGEAARNQGNRKK